MTETEALSFLMTLSETERERLTTALQRGRLKMGAGRLVLSSLGLSRHGEALDALKQWSAAQIVTFLEWGRQGAQRPPTEVIRTQPTDIGEGTDTAVSLRQLFLQAETEVVIAGFRLTERELFLPLIREAAPLKVQLWVDLDPEVDVYGRGQRGVDPLLWPLRWRKDFLREIWPRELGMPEIFYAPATLGRRSSMHIKTVIIDRRQWLVTSANFTSRGQQRNFELGALIAEAAAAENVLGWFAQMREAGVFVEMREV